MTQVRLDAIFGLDRASAQLAARQLRDIIGDAVRGGYQDGIRATQGFLGASGALVGAASLQRGHRRTPLEQAMAYGGRQVMGRGGMEGMVGRIGASALGFGGGLTSLPAQISASIGLVKDQDLALSNLNRRVGEGAEQFGRFRQNVWETGKELGIARDQLISLTNAYVSGVGRINGQDAISRNIQSFAGLARGYGLDPNTVVGAQTSLFRAGLNAPGLVNSAIAASVEAGGMRGREAEVIKAIERQTDLLSSRLPTLTPQMFMAANALMTAFNATGIQGLMGERGQQTIGAVDQFFQTADPVRRNFLYRSINNYRMNQGQSPLGYVGLRFQAAEGIGNMQNLGALGAGLNALPGDPQVKAILAQSLLGLSSPQQAMALMTGMNQFSASGGDYTRLQTALAGSSMSAVALPYAMRALTPGSNYGNVLSEFGQTLTGGARNSFYTQSKTVGSAEEAVALIAKFGDSTDATLTAQDKQAKAFTDFANSIQDFTRSIMPIVVSSMNVFSHMLNYAGAAVGALVTLAHAADLTAGALTLIMGAQAFSAIRSGAMSIRGAVAGPGMAGGPMGPGLPATLMALKTANPATRAAAGGIGGTLLRGAKLGFKSTAGLALAFGGLEAAGAIINGDDPTDAIGRALFSTGGSILGAMGGTALLPGIGTVAGGIGGGIAGNALWDAIHPAADAQNKSADAQNKSAAAMNAAATAMMRSDSVIGKYFDDKNGIDPNSAPYAGSRTTGGFDVNPGAVNPGRGSNGRGATGSNYSVASRVAAMRAAGFSESTIAQGVAISMAEWGGSGTGINNSMYPDRPGYHLPGPGASPEYSVGPWQINLAAHKDITEAQAMDLYFSTKYAYQLSQAGSNWNPWGAFTNGSYRAQMGPATDASHTLNGEITFNLNLPNGTTTQIKTGVYNGVLTQPFGNT